MKNEKFDGYNSVFAERFRGLIEENKDTQSNISKKLKIARQTVSMYFNGETIPTADKLYQIANYFKVSTDYLLGLTKNKTPNKDLVFFLDTTGLNEKTVQLLSEWKKEADEQPTGAAAQIIPAINAVLSNAGFNDVQNFFRAFVECRNYLQALLSNIHTETDSNLTAKETRGTSFEAPTIFQQITPENVDILDARRFMQAARYSARAAFDELFDDFDGYKEIMQELKEKRPFLSQDSTETVLRYVGERLRQIKPKKEGDTHADD